MQQMDILWQYLTVKFIVDHTCVLNHGFDTISAGKCVFNSTKCKYP